MCPLQHIGDNAAGHHCYRHPEREPTRSSEVKPKGIFNDPVGEGVKQGTRLGYLIAFSGNDAVYGIKREDDNNDSNECDVQRGVSAEHRNNDKGKKQATEGDNVCEHVYWSCK